MLLIILFIMYS